MAFGWTTSGYEVAFPLPKSSKSPRVNDAPLMQEQSSAPVGSGVNQRHRSLLQELDRSMAVVHAFCGFPPRTHSLDLRKTSLGSLHPENRFGITKGRVMKKLHLTALSNHNITNRLTLLLNARILNLLDDIHAVDNFAEDDMFVVEEGGGNGGDEELAAVGVWSRVLYQTKLRSRELEN